MPQQGEYVRHCVTTRATAVQLLYLVRSTGVSCVEQDGSKTRNLKFAKLEIQRRERLTQSRARRCYTSLTHEKEHHHSKSNLASTSSKIDLIEPMCERMEARRLGSFPYCSLSKDCSGSNESVSLCCPFLKPDNICTQTLLGLKVLE